MQNTFVGHPVNVATGVMFTTKKDVMIPGKMVLTWERLYHTGLLSSPPRSLGQGWSVRYFATLVRKVKEFHFLTPEGNVEIFADPGETVERGGVIRNLGAFQELSKRDGSYVVTRWDIESGEVECYRFSKPPSREAAMTLVSIEDLTGQGIDLRRDQSGRLVRIEQRLEKRLLHLEYDKQGRIYAVSFSEPGGHSRLLARYEYNEAGYLIAAFDALGFADRYEYDEQSRMTREIVKDGGVFSFKYDSQGRCVRTSGLDRYDEKCLRFFDATRWTEVTNSLGGVSRYQSLPTGQVVCEINPNGEVKRTEYDDYGRITARTNPLGAVTRYEYDDHGNRCKIVAALGDETLFTFNDKHQPVTLLDAAGNLWRRSYDRFNRISICTDPLGGTWKYIYDANGNLVRLENPKGASLQLHFSQNGILTEIVDWEGNRTKYKRDSYGRILEIITPDFTTTRFKYDLLGRVIEWEFPEDRRLFCTYDQGNNLVTLVDSQGKTWKYRYGPCRRRLEQQGPLGRTFKYRWGTEPGMMTEIVNELDEAYQFTYDLAGRVVKERGFDGREVKFVRDQAGNCRAFVNGAGERINYVRDLLGRPVQKFLPDGSSIDFEYDSLGYLISAKSPDSVITLKRDPFGRVLREAQNSFIVEYKYDQTGNPIEIQTSLGYKIQREFNRWGSTVAMTANGRHRVQFEHDSAQREVRRTLEGALELTQSYDSSRRPTEQQLRRAGFRSYGSESQMGQRGSIAFGQPVIRRSFTYGAGQELTALYETFGGDFQYIYDQAERVVQVINAGGQSEAFDYDPAGNLTRCYDKELGGIIFRYAAGNRLLERGTTQYSYDDQGRLIKKTERCSAGQIKEWSFTWNALDQLVSVQTPEGTVWHYLYDAFGRRIGKKSASKTIHFLWDHDVIIQQVENDVPNTAWVYHPHSHTPLLQLSKETPYFVVEDQVGAPRELVDSSGQISWSARYKLWGRAKVGSEESIDCAHRFLGHWFDEETGLHYNRYRYYDPDTGRYISQDPIRLLGGKNPYRYVLNPLNWIDLYGLGTVFRGIKTDADGNPIVYSGPVGTAGNPANSLGLRPGEEGMSTGVDPNQLPQQRRPADFGGTQKGAGMFAIDEDALAKNGLKLDPNDMDSNHRTIIPSEPDVSREEFEKRLAASRDDWKEVTPEEAKEIIEKEKKGCGSE